MTETNTLDNLYTRAAVVFHERHYETEEAERRVAALLETYKPSVVTNIAIHRAEEPTAWWDNEDAVLVAAEQLKRDFLYMDSIKDFGEVCEKAVGRSFGANTEAEISEYLIEYRWSLLEELTGPRT